MTTKPTGSGEPITVRPSDFFGMESSVWEGKRPLGDFYKKEDAERVASALRSAHQAPSGAEVEAHPCPVCEGRGIVDAITRAAHQAPQGEPHIEWCCWACKRWNVVQYCPCGELGPQLSALRVVATAQQGKKRKP